MELLAVFTSVADDQQAQALAKLAVERGLAACVQAEPIRSTYRWKGALAEDAEVRLLFKTTTEHYPALEQLIREHHPYELPAIFACAVTQASDAYAAWVRQSVQQSR